MSDHHESGPSTLGRRYSCPGSAREERGLPDSTTIYAEEGTNLHSLVERVLRLELHLDEIENEEHARLVGACVAFAGAHLPHDAPLEAEVRMALVPEEEQRLSPREHAITYGTADLVAYDKHAGEVFLVDWKFGRKEQTGASATLQVSAYVAMSMQRHDAEVGYGWLYQPRLGHSYQVTIQRSELAAVVQKIEAVIDRVSDPEAPVVAGDHCQYCRALGLCAATQEATREVAELVPAALDASTVKARGEAIRSEIKRWPADRVCEMLDAVELAKLVCKAHDARVRECLEYDADCIPGRELKEQSGARSADAVEAYHHIAAPHEGVGLDEYLSCCTVSVAKLERLVGKEFFDSRADGIVRQPTIRKLQRERTT